MREEPVFNPLDKRRLAESVSHALLERHISDLPPADAFVGAGIYALYYSGDFALYKDVAKVNRDGKYGCPIYVGKAVPKGSRKGGFDLDSRPGFDLHNRLSEHAETIQQAVNLELDDFRCRYLVVDEIFIKLGESLLIHRYSPIWNQALDGFGNHDPGKGRYRQQRSPWDMIHPGRAWARRCAPNRRPVSEIAASVLAFVQEKHSPGLPSP